jgi:RNA polymerase sigma factor (TIGR02999 family)
MGTTPANLFPLVYEELRKLAAAKLVGEGPGHTLDATALVHEVWLKLQGASIDWTDQTHFFRTAATAMRRILVDRARAKLTRKRSDGKRVELDEIASPVPEDRLLDLDEAIDKLTRIKPNHAKLVELRFFAGMSSDDAASVLDVSPATADRMWYFAKAWLQVELGS